MSRRQPRAGRAAEVKPEPAVERADHIIERTVAGGPEFLRRDLEGWREEFIAEQDTGMPSTYGAFMAVATSTARAVSDLDASRRMAGLPEVRNFATEVPQRNVEIPLWAAVALSKGWLRATVGEPHARQTERGSPHPLPLSEAFGLAGEGGSRTVGKRHLAARRDRALALEVEALLSKNPGMRAHAAHRAVADTRGDVHVKTVERAHAQWGARARERLGSST